MTSILLAIGITVLVTGLVMVVMLNIATSEKRIEPRIPRFYGTSEPDFTRSMGTLLGPAIIDGNRIEVLLNGDEIFPAMLKAINGAERSITFETFIYWSGDIGAAFAQALAAKARAGIAVHILLDWVGSRAMDTQMLDAIRDAGVQVNRYHPPSWYHLVRMNNRTHRKLLIVDGTLGFTGGVGIAQQ